VLCKRIFLLSAYIVIEVGFQYERIFYIIWTSGHSAILA